MEHSWTRQSAPMSKHSSYLSCTRERERERERERDEVVAAPLLVPVVVVRVVEIVVVGMLVMITISTVAAFGEAS